MRANILSLFLLSLLSLGFCASISSSDPSLLVRYPGDAEELREILASKEDDFFFGGDGKVQIFLSEDEFSLLQSRFPTFEVVERAMPLKKKMADIPEGYLDLDGIWSKIDSLVREFPTLIQRVNLTGFGPGLTYEGREMPMVKISDNVARDEDEPNILIVASHHCREIINPHIVLDLMERLLRGYSTDQRLRKIVDGNELFLSPLWNPDGYDYVWKVNNMWRKNRKPVGNTYGVDQNRNYPYGWDKSCSGSSVPSSETYKGPSAASEEETQIMMAFSRSRNFAKVNDFHSHGREVLHSFVCEPFPSTLDAYITQEAKTLASKTGITYKTREPSGDGQDQQFHIKEETAYSFLTETQLEFQPSYADAKKEIEYLWSMNLYFLERPIPYLGHVFSQEGAAISASIEVEGLSNLFWKSNSRFGSYHLFLPDGQYNVTFSASGYRPTSRAIKISNTATTVAPDVFLTRA